MPAGSPSRLPPFDALLLTGGAATRLGGVDKPALVVGGRTLQDRVTAAVDGAHRVVVAGPEHGGGPVAAIAAVLPEVTAAVVVVLPGDLPFVTVEAVTTLRNALAAAPAAAVAIPVDGEGRDQMLCAAWRTAGLRQAVASIGEPAGASVRRLLAAAGSIVRVPAATTPSPWFDCDTAGDVARARDWAQDGRL